MNQQLPAGTQIAREGLRKALEALKKITYKKADQDMISEYVGTAKGQLVWAIRELDEYFSKAAPEPDATPIDADTFDGDVFQDKKNAWIVAAALEFGFTPDYDEIAYEMPDECFTIIHSGWLTGKHEHGSDGWNECVKDYWTDDMDVADKAAHIIKKDGEDSK